MQIICVEVLVGLAHAIPSIITYMLVPKLDPVIVTTVPPMLGPNKGDMPVTTAVLLCEYVIAKLEMLYTLPPLLIETSHG